MGDDWEEDDWDAAATNFAAKAVISETKGAAALSGGNEPDMSKFAGEEEEEEEDDEPVHKVVASQPKKKEEKKYMKGEAEEQKLLDDPQLEKQRQQRLIEQADYAAAKELFGDIGGVNLDVFLPKSMKDFEEYAATIANKYAMGHKDSKNYKAFVKSLLKQVCAPLPSIEMKDIETSIAVVRQDKMKAEKEAAEAAAKTKVKKSLNMGKGKFAGLDDYIYDDSADHDDYDFM